ncbi:MAG TPA: N-acetyltransferase [Pseudonocardiaceae bacterium]|nr:N-acetyltransferase [Pseudonocardiaceae bacterium]
MTGTVAELADLMRSVADGEQLAADAVLTVVPPPDERSVGVLVFGGHNVVSTDVAGDRVRSWLPDDDLSAPTQPQFLTLLAAATGRVLDNLDLVLVAQATGRLGGAELTELTEFVEPLPHRLARALAVRIGVRAWRCPGGLLTLGRGVAGRWEVSVEVEPALRGFGLGRGLFTAARGLLPAGELVWAQVAPGNAASVRAALAAGFRPVGAEVLLHQGEATFGQFGWFEDRTDAEEPQPPVEPNTVDQLGEADQAQAQLPGKIQAEDDDLATNVDAIPPLSVLDDPTTEDESVD